MSNLTREEVFSNKKCRKAINQHTESLSWGEYGWEPIDNTSILRKYPEYLPTDKNLETIVEYSPLLEVGAGNGYWSKKIDSSGGKIVSTDIFPHDFKNEKTFYDISKEDHTIVLKHKDKSVLLCHPPSSDWSLDLLEMMEKGQEIIFVGEVYGCDATPDFFKYLQTCFDIIEVQDVIDWKSHNAKLIIAQKYTDKEVYYTYGSEKLSKCCKRQFEKRYIQDKVLIPENRIYNFP